MVEISRLSRLVDFHWSTCDVIVMGTAGEKAKNMILNMNCLYANIPQDTTSGSPGRPNQLEYSTSHAGPL